MNNVPANNAPALLKSLIIYAVLVPVALLFGFLLTNPLTASTFIFVGIVAFVLVFPLLVRWHYPWMLFCWSATMILFFVKGTPNVGQAMVVLSLILSILERIMNPNRQFIRVPSITFPLMAFLIIVMITAKLNGGIGMHAFGSDVYGGRKYVLLFIGIAGYFALTSRPIPPEKAKLYTALFLLGGMTTIIGDLYPIAPSWAVLIFHFFPPSIDAINKGFELGQSRLGGLAGGAICLYLWMLARYGLRGIFLGGKLWRPVVLVGLIGLVLLGGYRGSLFVIMMSFMFMFFAEGLYRTRMLGILVLAGTLCVTIALPLADKLPFTFQRALSFLPVHVSVEAKASADASTNWRIAMWTALLPQIPPHLLVGKGFAISVEDFDEMMGGGSGISTIDAADGSLALAGDYHNGMISVVLCFGIWGVIVIVWFIFVGLRVMYFNMRYGRPELFTINAILFIVFFNESISYLSCFGGLSIASDMMYFTGPLGMSVALNHGMCRPPPKPVALVETVGFKRLIPVRQAFHDNIVTRVASK
jgi:hypothetical protein